MKKRGESLILYTYGKFIFRPDRAGSYNIGGIILMKKKLLSVLLVCAMALAMTACGGSGSDKIKVGMVTDTGGVNDGSFN